MTLHAPLIIDIEGLQLSKQDRRRLKHPLVGGLVLFSRNWDNREQLTALCESIKAVRRELLICVDHEGGRVQRFKSDGFTHVSPMQTLGEVWFHGTPKGSGHSVLRACNAATAAGYVLGSELRACGVDLTFAPVLDLDHGSSSIIGDRSFARDPRVVSLLGKSLIHGLLQSGMGNCGKHFPGHGFVKSDSHNEIPVDKRSLKAILAEDAAPYGLLSSSLSGVMPAHVVYPRVDSRPAGFSSKWLQTVLREKLHFNGAIFSDDLSMAGARIIDGVSVSYTEAAIAALEAGCDMVLLCNQSLQKGIEIDHLIEGLSEAQLKGLWIAQEASEERRRKLIPLNNFYGWDELMVQAEYMHALSLLP